MKFCLKKEDCRLIVDKDRRLLAKLPGLSKGSKFFSYRKFDGLGPYPWTTVQGRCTLDR
jgi:hypothetical protein